MSPVNTTTSTEVPGYLPVAIAGHVYLIDPAGYQRETVPVLRQQADASDQPGESSLNPRGLWRRSAESWHHGAGQSFLDGRTDTGAADPYRYRNSFGIDPWTPGQLTLLPDTIQTRESTNTNLAVLVTATRIYMADGNELYHSTAPVTVLPNSTFDVNVTGWANLANAAVAHETTVKRTGAGALRVTSSAAGVFSVTTPVGASGVAVTPGARYKFSYYIRTAVTSQVTTPTINWYDSGGVLLSSTSSGGATDVTTEWRYASLEGTAPASAAFAAVAIEWGAAAAGGEIHYVDDAYEVGHTFSTSAIQAGEAAQAVKSITTDGTRIWAALGTSGIHRTVNAATSSTANVPGPGAGWLTLVAYANGRLLAAGSHTSTTARNVLFEVVDPLGTPALGDGITGMRFVHPNPDFVWMGISPGRNCIYAYGNVGGVIDATHGMYLGGQAEVYRITINPTDTALTAPTFATYLPDGEAIHALQFYAGGVIMGTSKGVRTATVDGAGNIDYGPLIETPGPVFAIEPQGRFVWFSYMQLDTGILYYTGLGRLDLGYFTSSLVPAWAPDLVSSVYGAGQAPVVSIASFTYQSSTNGAPSRRYFAIPGQGFWTEDASAPTVASDRISSGHVESGGIRYATTERKTTRSLDVRHHVLDGGTVVVKLRMDDAASYTTLGTSSTLASNGPVNPFSTSNAEGESAETMVLLTRSSTDPGVGPEVVRWTLKALPIPRREETFTLPIIMKTAVVAGTGDGVDSPFDIEAEVEFLKGLEQAGTVCKLQVGEETYDCFIDASSFKGEYWNEDRTQLEGIFTLQMQTVAS